jgi:hypothetical protein
VLEATASGVVEAAESPALAILAATVPVLVLGTTATKTVSNLRFWTPATTGRADFKTARELLPAALEMPLTALELLAFAAGPELVTGLWVTARLRLFLNSNNSFFSCSRRRESTNTTPANITHEWQGLQISTAQPHIPS